MVEDVAVKKFTFAISSPDEFLVLNWGRGILLHRVVFYITEEVIKCNVR